MKLCLVLLILLPLVRGLTDEEIAEIINRAAESNGRCGSSVTVTSDENEVTIKSNGLPDHEWGCVNPNFPGVNERTYAFTQKPEVDPNGPYCLPGGSIALAKNGVVFFDPLALGGTNAVDGTTQEIFDCCDGHPQDGPNQYHYHKLPHTFGLCDNPIFNADDQSEPQFLGVAFDGFPIYSQWDSLDTSKMDECHGTSLPDGRYAYIAKQDHFPYIMGCYKARPSNINQIESCSNAKANELCSCQYGQLTYDDVTVSHKHSMAKEARDLTHWYIKWARHAALRKAATLPMPMEGNPKLLAGRQGAAHNVEECYSEGCSRDWVMINGRCRRAPPV